MNPYINPRESHAQPDNQSWNEEPPKGIGEIGPYGEYVSGVIRGKGEGSGATLQEMNLGQDLAGARSPDEKLEQVAYLIAEEEQDQG